MLLKDLGEFKTLVASTITINHAEYYPLNTLACSSSRYRACSLSSLLKRNRKCSACWATGVFSERWCHSSRCCIWTSIEGALLSALITVSAGWRLIFSCLRHRKGVASSDRCVHILYSGLIPILQALVVVKIPKTRYIWKAHPPSHVPLEACSLSVLQLPLSAVKPREWDLIVGQRRYTAHSYLIIMAPHCERFHPFLT